MRGHSAIRQKRDTLQRLVALLFTLAIIAERASVMPAPVRCLALHFLRRAERTAHSYVHWLARECGAPLQWALPDATRESSGKEAALALAWWLRILAVALRDLPRRAFAVSVARLQSRTGLARGATPVWRATDRPIALDSS